MFTAILVTVSRDQTRYIRGLQEDQNIKNKTPKLALWCRVEYTAHNQKDSRSISIKTKNFWPYPEQM